MTTLMRFWLATLVLMTAFHAHSEENPFLRASTLDFGTYEFDKIKTEHYIPALKKSIEEANKNIDAIANNKEEPTFDNTLYALEHASDRYEYVAYAFYGLRNLMQDDFTEIAPEFQELSNSFSNKVSTDKRIFARVKKLFEKKDELKLEADQLRLLTNTYESYVRNGAELSDEILAQVKDIEIELGKLTSKFSENSTKSKESYELLITDEKKLEGLSQRVKDRLKNLAQAKGKEGFLLTLASSDYSEVMSNVKDEEIRKTIYNARRRIAFKNGPMGREEDAQYDNRDVVIKIAQLRHKKAKLLGFDSHARLQLQDKMIESPENLSDFLNGLIEPIKKAANKEFALIKNFKKNKAGTDTIDSWSLSYWLDQYKKANLGVDHEEIKKYFVLSNSLKDGALKLGTVFWGLKFKLRDDLPKYHEDVITYEVIDGEKTIGLVYFDLYARKGKRSGAWMMPMRSPHINLKGEYVPAIIGVSMNISKPAPGAPTLLSVYEVETLFHEMGHAYHGLLSEARYKSQSGTSVAWDFVEVPSQVPENFVIQPEVLQLYARHYETGEVIPKELIEKVVADGKSFKGLMELRQSSLELIDLAWYTNPDSIPTTADQVGEFELNARKSAEIIPTTAETSMSTSFGHIFAGGYHAGYYGYKWARVLGMDLWGAFEEQGEFTLEKAKPVAQKMRETIYSKGDTKHAMDLFIDFRGREPKSDFFLKTLEMN